MIAVMSVHIDVNNETICNSKIKNCLLWNFIFKRISEHGNYLIYTTQYPKNCGHEGKT